uniref:Nuclear receptor domain-containing protein n=1 Tax=Macrostomum lignano TaxID=282301 RepID=A0A1I8GFI5_9PLAT
MSSSSNQQQPVLTASQLLKRPSVLVQPTSMSVTSTAAASKSSASANFVTAGKRLRLHRLGDAAADSPPPVVESSPGASIIQHQQQQLHHTVDNNGGNVGDDHQGVLPAEIIVGNHNSTDDNSVKDDDHEDDVLADVLGVARQQRSGGGRSRRSVVENNGQDVLLTNASSSTTAKNGAVVKSLPSNPRRTVTVRLARPSATSPTTTVVVSPTSAAATSISIGGQMDDDVIVDDEVLDDDNEDVDDEDAIVGQLLSAAAASTASSLSPTSSTWTPTASNSSATNSSTVCCSVCGTNRRVNLHYGVHACESCRNFFKRALANNQQSSVSDVGGSLSPPTRLVCVRGGNQCDVTPNNRSDCKACRLRKCLAVGMSRESCKLGRRPLAAQTETTVAVGDDSLNRARALSDLQLQEALQQARAEDRVLHRRVVLKTSPHQPASASSFAVPSSSSASTVGVASPPAIEIIRDLTTQQPAASSEEFQQLKSSLIDQCQQLAGGNRTRDSIADEDFKILPVQREYCRDLLSEMIQQLEDPVLDSVLRRRQARDRLCRELVKISLEIMASGRTARNLVPFGYSPTSIVEQLQLYFKIVFGPDMLQEIVQSSQDLKNTPPQMDSTENFRDYLWNLYVFRMNFILSKVCDFAIKFGEFQSLSTADRCQIVLNCFKAAAILIHSQFWVVSPACYLLVQDRSLSLADMKAHFLYGEEFVRLSFEFTKDLVELRLKEEEFVIFLTLVIFFFGSSLSPPDLSGRGILTNMRRQLFSKLERVVGQQRRYLRVLQLWRSLKKLVTEEDKCVGNSASKIVDKCLQHYNSGSDNANAIRLYPDLFLTKQTHLVQIWLSGKK